LSRVGSYSPRIDFDLSLNSERVTGADEAGRGCLAGPLVAAAVTLNYHSLTSEALSELSEVNDSKSVTAKARERIFQLIIKHAESFAVVSRSASRIDSDGLHRTNISALQSAVDKVATNGAAVIVDGFTLPECRFEHQGLKAGDKRSTAVAAASILAKVTRDRYMLHADTQYPEWGFSKHKGYGTKDHSEAITVHGLTPLHRLSFKSAAYTQVVLEGSQSVFAV